MTAKQSIRAAGVYGSLLVFAGSLAGPHGQCFAYDHACELRIEAMHPEPIPTPQPMPIQAQVNIVAKSTATAGFDFVALPRYTVTG